MVGRGLNRAAIVLLGAPGVAVSLLFGVSGAAALATGRPLIWPPRDVTLSEAVALRDRGEVAKQIAGGVDPNGRYAVRGIFRSSDERDLTPLEAAVIGRETYMVDLVFDYGAMANARDAVVLRCLAEALRAEDIAANLAERFGGAASCDGVAIPWDP